MLTMFEVIFFSLSVIFLVTLWSSGNCFFSRLVHCSMPVVTG